MASPDARKRARRARPSRSGWRRSRPGAITVPDLERLESRSLLSNLPPGTTTVDPPIDGGRLAAETWTPRAQWEWTGQAGGLPFWRLAPGTYLVVPESTAPHQSPEQAQWFPDVPLAGVVGWLGKSDGEDFYRLTLQHGADRLDFGLVGTTLDSAIPMRLNLLDESGQLLGSWSTGPQGSTLHATMKDIPPGTTLYLGVASDGSVGNAAGGYKLWVSNPLRVASPPSNNLSIALGAASSVAPLLPGLAVPLAALSALVPPPSATGPVVARALEASAGSMDIRLAPLSSGVVATGNEGLASSPVPMTGEGPWPVASAAAVSVSPPRSEPGPGTQLALDAEAIPGWTEAAGTLPERVVPAGDSGGFPLLGAVKLGVRGITGRGLAPVDLALADPADPMERSTLSNPAESEVRRSRPGGQSGAPTISAFSSFGLATAWSLNALLSQPAAGFDCFKSYFDARSRERGDEAGVTSALQAATTRLASTIRRLRRSGLLSTQRA